MYNHDGKIFKDCNGNTYKIIGQRILVNDNTVLKSWFNCTTVEDIKIIGSSMQVYFKNGYTAINGIEEIENDSEDVLKEYELINMCMSYNPNCPGKQKEDVNDLSK